MNQPGEHHPMDEPDLNFVRDQVREGAGGPKRDLAEVLSEPGGAHAAHFVNPDAHSEETYTGPSLADIRDAAERALADLGRGPDGKPL